MGIFVVFEGPDGSGKSTQVRMLERELSARGYPVVTTREPGGTPVGNALRDLFLGLEAPPSTALTQAFMLNAARSELVSGVIRPALAKGSVVISDRYMYSSLAYQSAGEGVDRMTVQMLIDIATQGLEPDLAILLDLPPAAGLKRKAAGELNRLDIRDLQFHERVRAAYREMADRSPDRWIVVDAEAAPQDIARPVLEHTLGLLHVPEPTGSP